MLSLTEVLNVGAHVTHSPTNVKSKRLISRKERCWKARKERRRMVVNNDVEIGSIPNLVRGTIVGHFCGKYVTLLALKTWLEENW
jgi:hypothetical protein